ncbi:MAG: hypothetical protein BECKG1743E_GA0114224_101921, partial [Candidatus Kentron sp. G]
EMVLPRLRNINLKPNKSLVFLYAFRAAISITYWFAIDIAIDLQSGLGFFR